MSDSKKINIQKLRKFESLELLASQVVEGFITGLHKSPFHGFSVEFAEHRLYNSGESTRHIDWKLYGKTEKLFVKRYDEETNLRCQLVIDHSSSMYFPKDTKGLNKLEFSIYCAAAIIQLLKRQRDAVGVSTFSDKVTLHTPAKSSVIHQKILYHELEKLMNASSENVTTDVAQSLHKIAEAIHKRSLVIIFSDMMDSENEIEMFSALQHLRHNKHEVLLFHTLDKQKELDFEFDNRPYTFVDSESGEEVKLNPWSVKEQYIASVKERTAALKLKCAQYKIAFVESDINANFNEVLMAYLVKRQKMK